jgi:PIN domain nuclease of toxin-antitoxin system
VIAPTEWGPAELSGHDGPVLLDTHIWVWYLEGDSSQMSPALPPILERLGQAGELRVLDISYWEVAMKCAKGKLVFAVEPAIWLQRAERRGGVRFLPLDREILLLSTRLPGSPHNDPADRMLIAAARLNSLPLVTADRLILDYAAANPGTRVVDARL